MQESRYEVAIALALLARCNGYLQLCCKTIGEFAETKAGLEYRDWTQMLSVGRRALQFPEVDVAFRSGALNWSKLRALVPVLTKENVTEWIRKASKMTSNQVERAVSQDRDPCVGGPTHAWILGIRTYERFSELANGLRRESGENQLKDEECFHRLMDELEALRRAAHLARVAEPASASQPHGFTRSRHIPAGIRRQAMIRARFACECCRNRFGLDVHHVVPFGEGGSHELDNLVVLCRLCHVKLHGEDRREEPPAPEPSRNDGDAARPDGDAAGSEAMDTASRNGSPPQSSEWISPRPGNPIRPPHEESARRSAASL